MKKPLPSVKIIGLIILGFLIIVLLDKFFISKQVPAVSNAILVRWKLLFFGYKVPLPQFGLIPVLAISFLLVLIVLLPFKKLRSGQEWRSRLRLWWKIMLWTICLPLIMIIGSFFYKFLPGETPGWIKVILESFGITITPVVLDNEWQSIDGTIATTAGLLFCLFTISGYFKKAAQLQG